MNKLLSIIMPLYKVEKYIEETILSIINQSPTDEIEILIVDDGSPDKSVTLIKNLLEKQSHEIQNQFKIISQPNRGVSVARNTGLANVQGKYIGFLDADDLLMPDYFKNLLFILKQYQPDLIDFRCKRFDEQGRTSNFLNIIKEDGFYPLDRSILQLLCDQCAWFPWLKIYKAELFDNIVFPEGKNFEDPSTIPYVVLKAKNIYFLNKVLVKYRVNPTSITNTKSKKNIDDLGDTVIKTFSYFPDYPQLIGSAISLSNSYISDSLTAEGYVIANHRWKKLKHQLTTSQGFNKKLIFKRGNRLFFNFGINFLVILHLLKWVKLKK